MKNTIKLRAFDKKYKRYIPTEYIGLDGNGNYWNMSIENCSKGYNPNEVAIVGGGRPEVIIDKKGQKIDFDSNVLKGLEGALKQKIKTTIKSPETLAKELSIIVQLHKDEEHKYVFTKGADARKLTLEILELFEDNYSNHFVDGKEYYEKAKNAIKKK